MTLPLAIRPRIRLRDEPERTRAAWAPPPWALPVAVYWGVMGFLTYGVSKAPSWLANEGTNVERSAIDVNPIERFTRVVARSDAPPAKSELPVVLENAPSVRNEAPPLRTGPQLEPMPALSTTTRAAQDEGRTRDAERSHRRSRPADDSVEIARPSVALHFDPVPQESFPMRDIPGLMPFAPAPDDAPPVTAHRVPRATSNLPSCESAAAASNNEWDLTAARGAPDLTRDAYAALLENGTYFSHCAVPAGTALDICAAVQKGRALGITVAAHPANPHVSACVKAAVESVSFPSHPRLDVTRTHFDAVSGR